MAWSLWLLPSVWVNLVGLSLILWSCRCKPCRSVFRPLLEFLFVVKITWNIILSFLGIVVCISVVDEVSSSWFYKNWLRACFSSLLNVRLFPLTAALFDSKCPEQNFIFECCSCSKHSRNKYLHFSGSIQICQRWFVSHLVWWQIKQAFSYMSTISSAQERLRIYCEFWTEFDSMTPDTDHY